jgi:multidrug efflux pump subunit AcrB
MRLDLGAADTRESWGDLPVHTGPGGVVRLRDVAVVVDTTTRTTLARADGRRVICLPLFASDRAAPPTEEVRAVVGKIAEGLPGGTTLDFLLAGGADAEVAVYLRTPDGTTLEAAEKRAEAVERFLERAVPAAGRAWVVSEVGLRADESALYSLHAGPQDATIRVGLTDRRARPATQYAAAIAEAFS